MSLKELIGSHDANKLLEDSKELQRINTYWDEQAALKREQEESPEETNTRLKNELQALKQKHENEDAQRKEIEANQQALRNYEQRVVDMVDDSKLSDSEKRVLTQLLGVENPIDNVEIDNPTAVKKAVDKAAQNFTDFIEQVKQQAIDDYAAGKSKLKMSKTTATESPAKTHKKTPIPKDASVEQTFDLAKQEFLESLTKLYQEE